MLLRMIIFFFSFTRMNIRKYIKSHSLARVYRTKSRTLLEMFIRITVCEKEGSKALDNHR